MKIKAFFRIKEYKNNQKRMCFASFPLHDYEIPCRFNKNHYSKLKKTLFFLMKKEKIILMRSRKRKTNFS